MRRASSEVITAVCALALALLVRYAQAGQLVELGEGKGFGINNAGQVVLSTGLYDSGTITPLPMLPGGTKPVIPLAINENGVIVGTASDGDRNICVAFLYDGTLRNLGAPFGNPALDCATASAINNNGEVVGWSTVSRILREDAFLYSGGNFEALGTFPGQIAIGGSFISKAYGINDSRQITGVAYRDAFDPVLHTSQSTNDAFIYNNGTWTSLGPGVGYAINSSGEVTGATGKFNQLDVGSGEHAFIYKGGTMRDLGTLPGTTTSIGFAINSTGQVVGSSATPGSTPSHAFFYSGTMVDLNDLVVASDPLKPFVTLTDARGINDERLILVNGIDSRSAVPRAYLLQVPRLDFSDTTLTFPNEPVGTASPSQSVSVTNSGPTALPLDSVTVAGDFTQTNDCPMMLQSQASCTLSAAFAPAASGALTGSLTVVSDKVPFVIALSGTAPVSLTISATPISVSIGSSTSLHWTSSAGTTCTASGGASGDGWSGSVASNGSQAIAETTPGTYKYSIDCTAGSQTGYAETSVTFSPLRRGGGGAFDGLTLAALLTLLGLGAVRIFVVNWIAKSGA